MPSLKIVEYPDPILREQSVPVADFNSAVSALVDNLIDTLNSTTGIGLSAPQVGCSYQIMVMDLSEDKSDPQVLINPKIVSKSGFAIAQESCLSIPGVSANIIRSGSIRIVAKTLSGSSIESDFENMHAICVQHEIDHLQGKLFIDRVSRLRKLRFKNTLNALEHSTALLLYCSTALLLYCLSL